MIKFLMLLMLCATLTACVTKNDTANAAAYFSDNMQLVKVQCIFERTVFDVEALCVGLLGDRTKVVLFKCSSTCKLIPTKIIAQPE